MTKKLYKTPICRLDVAYGISTHIIIRDDIAVFNLIYKTREFKSTVSRFDWPVDELSIKR
jgi:hypothetical protein